MSIKRILITLIAIVCFIVSYGQSKVYESLKMESKLLSKEINYSIYLPDGYDTSKRLYPVVYLLNGYTGSESDWIQYGNVQQIVDNEIKSGNITPMVIVMPDGDDRLYMNKTDGTYPFEDMLIKEFLPFIESHYNILKRKESRGISGLSMGGNGALRLALKYNDLFGSCAAYSSAIVADEEILAGEQNDFDNYFGKAIPSLKGAKGKERLSDKYRQYDLLHLVKTINPDDLNSVSIYFDCGDDDFLTVGNALFHIELTQRKINHEFRVRDGRHTWNYWRDSLPIGLAFISKTMTR